MKSILLFDTSADGHHTDYILHLINYWSQLYEGQQTKLIIVAPQKLVDNYNLHYGDSRINWSSSIVFEAIDPLVLASLKQLGMIKRSMVEWNLVRSYETKFQPSHIVLMYLDLFQVGMLAGKRLKTKFSGIFFRPMPSNLTPTFKNALLKFRKNSLLKLAILFSGISNLFCLDEAETPRIQALSSSTGVQWLPDPIETYDIKPQEIADFRHEIGIEASRKVLLLFGYLDDRKCVEQILEALHLLKLNEQKQTTLLLVGNTEESYKKIIIEKISQCASPEFQVIMKLEGVYGRNIQKYFQIANGILAVYDNHIGSSSVIIRAAVSAKPLLVKDFGYMGSFVKKYQVGMLVGSTDSQVIADEISSFLGQSPKVSLANMALIAQKNSAKNFAITLFNTVLK